MARAAQKAGRQVVMSGRAMHRITTIARELGMLEGIPPFLDQDAFKTLPRNKIVVLCTGSQGEPRAAISRIARGEHPAIDLNAGDRVIFSSWAIPGNEREVIDIQNMLIDRGIEVITQRDGLVHTTGHPRREELKRLYDWLKPQTLVPVHGEAGASRSPRGARPQARHSQCAHARNGDMVRLFPDPLLFPGEVRTGELYLDGNILCTPEESGVKGRRRLQLRRPYRGQPRGRRQRRHRLGPGSQHRGPAGGRGRRGLADAARPQRRQRRAQVASRPSAAPTPTSSMPRCSARCAARSTPGGAKSPM